MMRVNLLRRNQPKKEEFKRKQPLSEPPQMCAYIKGSTQKDGTSDMPDSCKEKGCTGYSKKKYCPTFVCAEELMGIEENES